MGESIVSKSSTNSLVTHLLKQEVFKSFRREVANFEERWRKSVSRLTQSIEFYNNNNINKNSNNGNNDKKIINNNLETEKQNDVLDNDNIKENKNENKIENLHDKDKLNFFIVENNLTNVVELQPVVLKTNISKTIGKNIEYMKQLKAKHIERQNQRKLNKTQNENEIDEYVLKIRKKYGLLNVNKQKNKVITKNSLTKLSKEPINVDQQSSIQPIERQNSAPELRKQKRVTFQTEKSNQKIVKQNNKKNTKTVKSLTNYHNSIKKPINKMNKIIAERDLTDIENKYLDKKSLTTNKTTKNCCTYINKVFYKRIKTEFGEKDQNIPRNIFKQSYKTTEKWNSNAGNKCCEKHDVIKFFHKHIQTHDAINNLNGRDQKNIKNFSITKEDHSKLTENVIRRQTKDISNTKNQQPNKKEEKGNTFLNINFKQSQNKDERKNNNLLSTKEKPEKENLKKLNLLTINKNNTGLIKEKQQRKQKTKKINNKKKKLMQVIKKQKKGIKFYSPYMKQLDVFHNRTKHQKLINTLYNKYQEEMESNKEEGKKCLQSRTEISPRLSSQTNNKTVGVPLLPFSQELENQIRNTGNTQLENFYKANRNKLGGLYFVVSSLIFRNENNISNFDLNSEFNDHKLGKPVWLDPDPRPNGFGPLKPRPHATYRRTSRPRSVPQEYVLFFGDPNVNLYTVEAV